MFQTTGADYFGTLGIELVRGRVFDARDYASAEPIAVIDEMMAERLFGREDPVGKRLAFEVGHSRETFKPRWRQVVGVVRHVKHYGLIQEPPYGQVYTPFTQLPQYFENRRPTMALVVRAQGEPEPLIGAIRKAVASVDASVPVYGAQPLTNFVDQTTEQQRLSAALISGFAGVALLLSAVGLYGVLAYVVSQRTREIGLRIALGAGRRDIIAGVVRQGLFIAAIGLAAGFAGAFAATRLIGAMLFNVSPTDPATFVAVAIVLTAVAAVASFVPARRASSVDPLVALRSE
jgi:predicted permease